MRSTKSTSPEIWACRANGGYIGDDSLDKTTCCSGATDEGSTCAGDPAAAQSNTKASIATNMRKCRLVMQEIVRNWVTVAKSPITLICLAGGDLSEMACSQQLTPAEQPMRILGQVHVESVDFLEPRVPQEEWASIRGHPVVGPEAAGMQAASLL